MTIIAEIRRSPLGGWEIVLAGAAAASFAFSVGMVLAPDLAPGSKERKLCDQMVSTALTTTDAVELQRAMFLIRELNCSIRRRL